MSVNYAGSESFLNQQIKGFTHDYLDLEDTFTTQLAESADTLALVSCAKTFFQHNLNVEQAEGKPADPCKPQLLEHSAVQLIGVSSSEELSEEGPSTIQQKIETLQTSIRDLYSNIDTFQKNASNGKVLVQSAKESKDSTNQQVITALLTKLTRMYSKLDSYKILLDKRKGNIESISKEHSSPALFTAAGFRDPLGSIGKLAQAEEEADAVLTEVELHHKTESDFSDIVEQHRFCGRPRADYTETFSGIDGLDDISKETTVEELADKVKALVAKLVSEKQQAETLEREATAALARVRAPLQTIAETSVEDGLDAMFAALEISDTEVKKKEVEEE